MREIKFRAWDELRKIMYSSKCVNLLLHFDGTLQSTDEYGNILGTINTPEMTIMQSIEIQDKNGKEIFIGDIIKAKGVYFKDRGEEIGIINKTKLSVYFQNISGYSDEYLGNYNELEIIGNIYENPELLETCQ